LNFLIQQSHLIAYFLVLFATDNASEKIEKKCLLPFISI